jgi:CubicO group peptidase (beta-lactamase class C family)
LVLDDRLATSGATGTLHDGSRPDDRTVYRIASMTKSFTAAVVLALRDEGVWQLDDPVARHAPELAAVQPPAGSPPLTLRQLLSMTSGLATDDAWADRHLDLTADEIDGIYATGPEFAFRPNDAFEYSNLGYGMLGRAVLRATGIRLQDHVTQRLLLPLGLDDTTWVQPAHDRWARPHRVLDGASVPDLPGPLGDGEIAPMGGLWTTVADLARWVTWLDSANREPHQPAAVGLSAASRREMQRVHTYAGVTTQAGRTSPTGYGFGLNLRDDAALGMVVAHSGGLPGYGSNMRWLLGRGIGVIALGNTTYAPMSGLTLQMLATLHDLGALPPVTPLASPTLANAAQRLVALLNDWDDAAARSVFADNVELDEAFERRAATAAGIVERHGPLQITALHVESLTSGSLEVRGAGPPLRILFDLAPLHGGRVQFYDITEPTPT